MILRGDLTLKGESLRFRLTSVPETLQTTSSFCYHTIMLRTNQNLHQITVNTPIHQRCTVSLPPLIYHHDDLRGPSNIFVIPL